MGGKLKVDNVTLENLSKAFPDLQLEKELGKGGQKTVYKAETSNGDVIALKIIHPDQDIERITREVNAVAQFKSEFFPEIFDIGKRTIGSREFVFVVEEFLEGQDLRTVLRSGKLSLNEAIGIGAQLLQALIEVFEKDMVHRDIKPENIIIGPNSRVVLLDFGIARHLSMQSLTQDLAIFGPFSPGYGAPEQIKNEKRSISFRTDLFSWAVVMYEMISGTNPFIAGCTTGEEIIRKTLGYVPPTIPECPSDIMKILNWCLNKPCHRRPPNPYIVLEKLKEVCY